MTPEAFARVMDSAYTRMRPWSLDEITQTLAQPTVRFLSTNAAGMIVRLVADECEILALATDPAAHRQGHASQLLDDLVDAARHAGVTRVFLEVACQNTSARAFYEARGFGSAGQRKAYYTLRDGTKDDAVLLSRPIP